MRLLLAASVYICCAAEPWEADLRLEADRVRLRDAPVYRIDATISTHTIDGTLRLAWRNDNPQPVSDLAFHTYANGPAFRGALLEVVHATVDGVTVSPDRIRDGLGVALPLAQPLPPQAVAAVELTWQLRLSTSGGNHGLLARRRDGTCILHAWYPEMAERHDGTWLVDQVPEMGDPARARAHHVVATLHLPDGGPVIAGGTIVSDQDDDGPLRTLTVAGAGVRNLSLVVGTTLQMSEQRLGDIRIRSWHHSDHAEAGRRARDTAASAVAFFTAQFGPYPWPELEVIEADLGGPVGGVESCGLVLIAGYAYHADRFAMLDEIVAHEVGHQWWQGMIGNDSVIEPWLDESLTSWSTLWWRERMQGPASGAAALQSARWGARGRRSQGFPSLLGGINDFANPREIGSEIYARGTLAWQALRKQVGDHRLRRALHAWAEAGRFRIATSDQLRAVLERELGAADLHDFWSRWVQGEGLNADDLEQEPAPFRPQTPPMP